MRDKGERTRWTARLDAEEGQAVDASAGGEAAGQARRGGAGGAFHHRALQGVAGPGQSSCDWGGRGEGKEEGLTPVGKPGTSICAILPPRPPVAGEALRMLRRPLACPPRAGEGARGTGRWIC